MKINDYCFYCGTDPIDGEKECWHIKNAGGPCYYDKCPLLNDDGAVIENYERNCDGDPVDRYYHEGEIYTLECE